MSLIACAGCGGLFPETDGPTHRYMESSPGCWACFGEVLAREYSDVRYAKAHRLTVDTYAVQHPGNPSTQSIHSVAIHLISLCSILEKGNERRQTTEIMQKAGRDKHRFEWLAPPPFMGELTVADVHRAEGAQEHTRLVRAWAESAWLAWSSSHAIIRIWLSESIKR